jgi:pilus assembly protein CpaE
MFGKADLTETEKVLRHKVDFPVSNDYPTVSAAIDEGRLISSIKLKSRVEKDLRTMINELTTAMAVDPALR